MDNGAPAMYAACPSRVAKIGAEDARGVEWHCKNFCKLGGGVIKWHGLPIPYALSLAEDADYTALLYRFVGYAQCAGIVHAL